MLFFVTKTCRVSGSIGMRIIMIRYIVYLQLIIKMFDGIMTDGVWLHFYQLLYFVFSLVSFLKKKDL